MHKKSVLAYCNCYFEFWLWDIRPRDIWCGGEFCDGVLSTNICLLNFKFDFFSTGLLPIRILLLTGHLPPTILLPTRHLPTRHLPTRHLPNIHLPTGYLPIRHLPNGHLCIEYLTIGHLPTGYFSIGYLVSGHLLAGHSPIEHLPTGHCSLEIYQLDIYLLIFVHWKFT